MLVEDYVRRLQTRGLTDSYHLLTDREKEVLQLLAEGRSNKEVATLLDLGLSTVETHRGEPDAEAQPPQHGRDRALRRPQGHHRLSTGVTRGDFSGDAGRSEMMSPGMTRLIAWARAMALDYDDTLAEDGVVEPAVLDGLERLKASGRRLVLVTGREIDDLVRVFPALAVFDRVVGENGAVLYHPETHESIALAAPPREDFIARLRREHVTPLSVGQVIVATRAPHEARVVDAIRALDLNLVVIRNKGAVMVLPAGINKGTGLREALGHLQIPPQDVVGVGDAENDFDLLAACGYGVAVANALPALAQRADMVTRSPGGHGVLELIDGLFASVRTPASPRRKAGLKACATSVAGGRAD